ncbi:MAG TPA: heme biosynthesis HemY N-terminal domain-containing protein [Gammaproteobacteria bacterium]
MRFLITLLLVLVATVALAVLVLQEPGYVLVVYEEWAVETTLSLLIGALVAGFILLYLLIRLLRNVWLLPQRMAEWKRARRRMRATAGTNRGLLALAEGNWAKAEKMLIRFAKESEMALINYLGAARAAQKQNASMRRDLHLADAHHSMPRATLAIGITQGELQYAQGQLEEALATLMHLRSIAPKHGYVLYLLMKVYERMGSWNELLRLLPELRRHGVLDSEQARALEAKVHQQLFASAAESQDLARLRDTWAHVPRELRQHGELIAVYVRKLMALGEGSAECEELLREAIKREFDPPLVKLYGLVRGADPARQLATAEGWLHHHPRDADLLLTLGRLALQNQLWGKARTYLEASLGNTPQPDTYCELANLLHDLGEEERARELYRQGLQDAARVSCAIGASRPRPRKRITP